MRAKALLAGVLLATILMIPGTMVQPLSLIGPTRVETVPSEVLRPVRTCLATIDQFIVDGDLTSLWQGLDQFGHGLDPWPQIRTPQRDLVALAFRATYPHMHFTLDALMPSDEFYAARIGVSDSVANLPAWLESQKVSESTTVDSLLALDELGAVISSPPAFPNQPLVFTPPDPGPLFASPGSSRLIAAHLTLSTATHGNRSIAVTGPVVIAPEVGVLRVEGDGRIFTPAESLTRWRRLTNGETATIAPGGLLYLDSASDTAVVTVTSSASAQLLYAAVRSNLFPDDTLIEGGHVNTSLAGTILSANAPSTAWFGSIDWVRQATGNVEAGGTYLSAAWLILPAGTSVVVDSANGAVISVQLPIQVADSAQPIENGQLSNSTGETHIMFLFRAGSH